MERRKFLLGVGSASVGGSALVGSGAFTSVEATRTVQVDVVEDSDALLGLDSCPDSPNATYAGIDSNGRLVVEIGETDDGGEGVNLDAVTTFDDVFQVCNNGTQDVCLWVNRSDDWPASEDGTPRVDFYTPAGDSILDSENAHELGVGECTCVGIRTDTDDLDSTDDLLESVDGKVTLVANSECPNGDETDGDDGEETIECTECAVPDNVSGDFLTIEEIDDGDFPEVSLTVRVETDDGIDGNLNEDDFAVCETFGDENFGQSESVTFAGEDEQAAADVVLCIDTSGSMGGTDIDNAKDGAKALVDTLGPGVKVGLVEFSYDASRVTKLTSDHEQVKSDIEGLSTGGGTDMEDGIVRSQKELDDNGRSDVPQFIVILGDGATSGEDEATDAKDKGTIIYGIAYGTGTDVDDYEYIVGEEEDDPDWNDYAFAADTEDITEIFEDIGGIISGTYNVTYTSCNPDEDGSNREVLVYVDDPEEGDATATVDYTAPSS